MSDVLEKKCVPCEGGTKPLSLEEAGKLLEQTPEWELSGEKIVREFKFKDFKQAMVFVNSVADIAEEEVHHPDIAVSWNKVTLTLWTHAIDGLSENDFIVAAKVDRL